MPAREPVAVQGAPGWAQEEDFSPVEPQGRDLGSFHEDDDELTAPDDLRASLPRLHRAAYQGDLAAVLECVVDPLAVHDTVRVRNQAGKVVCGITPLFLAAQRGHTKVVKLLITQGANPAQPAYIEGTDDLCTPAQVARLNFHFWTARYLNQQVAARKQGDKLLKKEEKMLSAASPDQSSLQHQAIVNLGDLTNWDPTKGYTPTVQNKSFVKQIFGGKKGTKIDLQSWKPDVSPTGAPEDAKEVRPSNSRVPDARELMELDADHTGTLENYLGQAPSWGGASDGLEPSAARPVAPSSRAATRQSSVEGAATAAPRAAAAAPGAAAAPTSGGGRATGAVAPASQRWYAHGDSDSDDGGEEDEIEAPSASVMAPPGTRY